MVCDSSIAGLQNGRIAGVIPAIVLAAGKSTRMGRPKANLPLAPHSATGAGGDTFLTRIVRTFLAAGIDDVVVVVGHEARAVVDDFVASGLPARLVENPDYESGQLSSLLAGLRVVDRPGVTAVLVTLVDVPLVSPATVRAVVDRYRQTHAPVVRPSRGDEHGHPLLIDRSLFDAVRRADAAEGVKPVIRAHATRDGNVESDDAGAFTDIDTPSDYELHIRATSTEPSQSGDGM
jgi:molybdenum cofactor cytidylyltransferase